MPGHLLSQFNSGLMQELEAETELYVPSKSVRRKKASCNRAIKMQRPVGMLSLLLTAGDLGEHFPPATHANGAAAGGEDSSVQ